jgi:hypothetical protein
MGRPPVEKKLRQIGVALSDDQRALLEAEAKRAGHSIAEEVRKRIERTVREDDLPAATRELRYAIVTIAAALQKDFGAEWFSDWRCHHEFAAALAGRIYDYRPIDWSAESGAVADLFASDVPPGARGILREKDDKVLHNYPQLEAALKARSGKKAADAARAPRANKEKKR